VSLESELKYLDKAFWNSYSKQHSSMWYTIHSTGNYT